MAFNFRLQKLLDYREEQKKMAQEDLARKQQQLKEIEGQLDELKKEEEELHSFHREQLQKTDLFTLFSVENYRQLLDGEFYQRHQELNSTSKDVEKQRDVVVEFWQSCEILNKLKEKSYQNYLEEEKVKERYLNDEIALFNYNSFTKDNLF